MPATLIDKLLPTITWTLVHSLWQGLILTVLAGLVLLLTRRSTAALRYTFLCTLFFLFLGGVLLTFLVEWNLASEPARKYTVAAQASSFPILFIDHWRAGVGFFLNQNAQWIVLGWILVLLFQSGRMLREIVYIRELRSRKTEAADPLWKNEMQALAEELGIRKVVSLVESAVVKVPIVIGHFKPVVMVPVGMLNHLSPGEMEAVLLHELAHIRRHDYLVNYLQRIAETLLFFNPGMLWVSSLLRAEREACCDEMAISHTRNKLQFVEALIRCKEHALQTSPLSLGLFGNRNLLLQRLNRIVSNRNKSLSLFEASFFGSSILVLMLIVCGWNGGPKPSPIITYAPIGENNYSFRQVVKQISEQPPQVEIKQKAVSNKSAYQVSSSRRLTSLKKQENREEAFDIIDIDPQRPDLNTEVIHEIKLQSDDHMPMKHYGQREEVEKRRAQADWNRMQAEKARNQSEIDRAASELHRQQADRDRQIAAQYREQAQKDRLRADRDRVEIQKLREQVDHRWRPENIQ